MDFNLKRNMIAGSKNPIEASMQGAVEPIEKPAKNYYNSPKEIQADLQGKKINPCWKDGKQNI